MTIYYLSSSAGADTNDGLSVTTPWKTLAQAASVFTGAQGGNYLLLKRGDVWHEEGTFVFNGASMSALAIIDAYGDLSLPLPLIDGADSAVWTLDSGSIWKTTVAQFEHVFDLTNNEENYFGHRMPDKTTKADMVENSTYFDGTATLYAWFSGSRAPDSNIEVCARTNGLTTRQIGRASWRDRV